MGKNKLIFEEALAIACAAHANQVDKCGEKYIFHPLYVSSLLDDEEDKIIALLHDVFEDYYPLSELYDLYNNGELSENAYNALMLLTHDHNDSYEKYINKITDNKSAVRVKIADLKHNTLQERYDKCILKGISKEKMDKSRKKYLNAIEFLKKYL